MGDPGFDVSDLKRYLPEDDWFRFRPRGIHGVPHVSRVLVWAAVLSERVARPDAMRREELLWAAAVHDVGRIDDGIDRGHGARSGDWVQRRLPVLRPGVRGLDVDFIAELCRWHEHPDRRIDRMTLELVILKDADGLDRCRLGDLDPNRLRLTASQSLIEPAARLERLTNRSGEVGGDEVLAAAARVLTDSSRS